MKLQFIPIDYDNFDYNDRNYAKIIGRTSEGKRVWEDVVQGGFGFAGPEKGAAGDCGV